MPSQRLSLADRDRLAKAVNGIRWDHAAAFPFEITDMRPFQEQFLNPLIVESYRAVESAREVEPQHYLEYSRMFRFTVEGASELLRACQIEYGWGQSVPPDKLFIPDRRDYIVMFRPEHVGYEELRVWVDLALKVSIQDKIRRDVVNWVIHNTCNTTGQLKRVWPDLVNFLPEYMAKNLNSAQKASRLPSGLTQRALFWMPQVSKWLAMGALLANTPYPEEREYTIHVDAGKVNEYIFAAEAGIDPLGVLE